MSAMGRSSKTSTNVESRDAAVGAGRGIVLRLVLLAGLLVAAAPARAVTAWSDRPPLRRGGQPHSAQAQVFTIVRRRR
jgi:hypothetical protein